MFQTLLVRDANPVIILDNFYGGGLAVGYEQVLSRLLLAPAKKMQGSFAGSIVQSLRQTHSFLNRKQECWYNFLHLENCKKLMLTKEIDLF